MTNEAEMERQRHGEPQCKDTFALYAGKKQRGIKRTQSSLGCKVQ